MISISPQYITDNRGRKISVVLPMKDFRAIIEQLEELEDIRLYDAVKEKREESIPVDRAFRQIESKRRKG
jgi:hypothetical protein